MTIYVGFVGEYQAGKDSITITEKRILKHILGINRFKAKFYTSFDDVYAKDHRRPAFAVVFVQPGHASQQLEYFKMMIDTKAIIHAQTGASEIETSISENIARLALPAKFDEDSLWKLFESAATPRYSKVPAHWPWRLVKDMQQPKRPANQRYGYGW